MNIDHLACVNYPGCSCISLEAKGIKRGDQCCSPAIYAIKVIGGEG